MEFVASDAKVLIELARRQFDGRSLDEFFHRPAVRNSHPFGMPHREGFVHRVAGVPLQDRFQFFFEQIADRRFRLDAAGEDIAVRFDGVF